MQSCVFVEDTALREGLQWNFRVFLYYSPRFGGFSFSPHLPSFSYFFHSTSFCSFTISETKFALFRGIPSVCKSPILNLFCLFLLRSHLPFILLLFRNHVSIMSCCICSLSPPLPHFSILQQDPPLPSPASMKVSSAPSVNTSKL